MKNYSHICLFSLLAAALLFTGCQSKSASTAYETTESTANSSEATESTEPEESLLDNVSFSLPEDMELETISADSKSILRGDETVGGLLLLSFDEEMPDDPLSDEFIAYLKDTVMPGIDEGDFVYAAETSPYAHAAVTFSNSEKEYVHYIYRGSSVYYDLWLDKNKVTSQEEEQMIQSVQSEDITADFSTELLQEEMSDTSAQLQFELPDEMECADATDVGGLIYSDGEIVGGYAAVDFGKGVLSDPSAYEEEIISVLVDGVKEQIDLSDYDAELVEDAYVKAVFSNLEEEYTHYVIYFEDADAYYDLWFDSKQVDEETITEIVNTACVVLP